ncbi:PQ-loop domain-containing transporter (plasmid) [Shinella yambaruensis]|uniref:SemiSWEET family sugar transporter n=1 Tax=Shinella yambaruensis TaxID=415996 RepID=UPI003D7C06ED
MSSFVPQAWKVVKSGDTSALSTRMYVLTVTGFALWAAFGVLKAEWPITGTNAICFCLSAFILLRKLGSRERTEGCQRRNNFRPRGGAKVGHHGVGLRPPGGRSPSGGLRPARRFFEGSFSQPFWRGSGRGGSCRRSSRGC